MAEYIPKTTLDSQREQKADKEKREKLEPVVAAPTKNKKKSIWDKVADQFKSEDAESIGDYVLIDVLIPAFKDTIQKMVTNAVDIFLYGNTMSAPRERTDYSSYGNGRVAYRNYYDQRNNYYARPRTNSGYDYNEIVFETRGDAEAVLFRMNETLAMYQVVRVADYLELSGRDSNYTDNNYGWTSLETVQIRRSRDGGYFLDLPRPMAID